MKNVFCSFFVLMLSFTIILLSSSVVASQIAVGYAEEHLAPKKCYPLKTSVGYYVEVSGVSKPNLTEWRKSFTEKLKKEFPDKEELPNKEESPNKKEIPKKNYTSYIKMSPYLLIYTFTNEYSTYKGCKQEGYRFGFGKTREEAEEDARQEHKSSPYSKNELFLLKEYRYPKE